MSTQTLGLLIGGLAPAVLFSVCNIVAKGSIQAGIGIGPYMIIIGMSVVVAGVIFLFLLPDSTVTARAGLYAFVFGITWGIASGLVGLALARYEASIAQIAPLFNLNTLFTVLLGLWIFAEWQHVKVPQLLIGSLLIVVGGVFVARA